MKKVDMSPKAISERLRITGELSEELLRSTFTERYEVLMRERAEISEMGQSVRNQSDELSDNTGDQVTQG